MKLIFKRNAYDKVQQLVTQCENELTGLGKVSIQDNNTMIVEDIIIFEQEVSSAHCELDKDKVMEFVSERVKEGDSDQWRLWWHSHATMGCFWSGIDEDNITRMGETAAWMVSVVFNHKMEYKARLDFWKPFAVNNIDILIETMPADESIIEWAKNEISNKIKEKQFKPIGYVSPYYSAKNDDYYNAKNNDYYGKDYRSSLDERVEDWLDNTPKKKEEKKVEDKFTTQWYKTIDSIKSIIIVAGFQSLNNEEKIFVKDNWEEFKELY